MKNNNIKDTFELFSPKEEQKDKIYKSILDSQKRKEERIIFHFKAKFARPLVACFILVVAVMLLNGRINNSSSSLLDDIQYYQANKPSKDDSSTADKKIKFKGFVLTAYAANNESEYLSTNFMDESDKRVLMPDVKVLLAKYSPAMSNLPGLPFTINITNDDKDSHDIPSIYVSSDSGELNKWNRETGVVSSGGQTTTIGIGETIYWSPNYNEDDANVNKITIVIEAVTNDIIIGRQSIYLTQDKPGYYYATIGELELL